MLEISIAAEKIGFIGSLPVTNSLLTTWIVMAIIFSFSFFVTRNMTMVPKGLQSVMELIVGGFYDFYSQIIGKHIKAFFPLVMSFFLFIIVGNWFGLLPGVGTVGFHETATEFIPLLRSPAADINMTLALALIAVGAIQFFGFKMSGFWYAQKFINLSNPLNFFIGALEIVSTISSVISFAFRLFGNIFAGEVLLAVMAFLIPFIAPLPFLSLELFVGFIQALVFSMLVAVFLTVAVQEGEHLAHQHSHAEEHKK